MEHGYAEPGMEGLKEYQGTADEVVAQMDGAEIAVTHLAPFSAGVLERLPQLKLIAVSRGGFPPTRRSSTKSSLSRFAIGIHQHHHPLSSLVRTQRSSFVSSRRCECWMSSKVAAQIFHLPYRDLLSASG